MTRQILTPALAQEVVGERQQNTVVDDKYTVWVKVVKIGSKTTATD